MEKLVNLSVLETLQNASGYSPLVSGMSVFNGQERVDKARKLYGQLGGNELFDMIQTNEIIRLLKAEINDWREALSITPVLNDSQKAELLDLARFFEEVKNSVPEKMSDVQFEIKKDDDNGEIIDVEFS